MNIVKDMLHYGSLFYIDAVLRLSNIMMTDFSKGVIVLNYESYCAEIFYRDPVPAIM